ncbi:MAG: hypothetical protein AB7L65_10955 [Hyphomonadaceae bacterium]
MSAMALLAAAGAAEACETCAPPPPPCGCEHDHGRNGHGQSDAYAQAHAAAQAQAATRTMTVSVARAPSMVVRRNGGYIGAAVDVGVASSLPPSFMAEGAGQADAAAEGWSAQAPLAGGVGRDVQ